MTTDTQGKRLNIETRCADAQPLRGVKLPARFHLHYIFGIISRAEVGGVARGAGADPPVQTLSYRKPLSILPQFKNTYIISTKNKSGR